MTDQLDKIKNEGIKEYHEPCIQGEEIFITVALSDWTHLIEQAEKVENVTNNTLDWIKQFAEDEEKLKERIKELEGKLRHANIQIKMYKLGDEPDDEYEPSHIP